MVIHNNPEEFEESVDAGAVPEGAYKLPETSALLFAALREHFLFSQLAESDLRACVERMVRHDYAAGEEIIRQGDRGSEFYVLEQGAAMILVDGSEVGEYGPSSSFGELALMYNCERAATVKATSACTAWTMQLQAFRRLLATTASGQVMRRCDFLRRVELLAPLTNEQVTKLADALESVTFEEGQYIIRQGEQGDTFYLIEEGAVQCTQWRSATDTTEAPLLTLSPGDYFGEMALMLEEPRAANCIAKDRPVRCLMLDRAKFFALLGPLQTVLQNNMRLRILKSVPLLAKLTDPELSSVADTLCVQSFEDGDYVIRQGEEGTRFYIINEGEVRCTRTAPGTGEDHELMRLGKGEFFGERALLKNEPRGANVIATGYVDCLVLEREDFNGLLGPLEKILEREISEREKQAEEVLGLKPLTSKRREPVALEDLKRIGMLGTGTFGRVQLVQHRGTGEVFALKSMMKAQIAKSHQQRNILNEKNILMACEHPLILDLVCTYNTRDELLMLTELLLGGELWSYIYERAKFKLIPHTNLGGFQPATARFYGGSVVLCLQYLHKMNVAYRDLKPENLLVAQDGYLKMIDFGFAKRIPFKKGATMQTKSFTLCGTPDYLAPELVLSRGHDKSVDYWALGCFIYELLLGRTPFTDPRQAEIFKKAIRSDRFLAFPIGFDPQAEDLIRKLLTPSPTFRLGNLNGGVKDIMDHPWFSSNGFAFDNLYNKKMATPYTPAVSSPLDTRHFAASADNVPVTPYTGPQKLFDGF
ncbi:putative cGMP-dependent protein kinase [Tribonema minus]|uniref:cGMP-dependent protein kinase n=1 Tax=Tribonema minus TaxID=303371 RepID=A0A835YV03_9STRA|nr:putative cGMP-dependent protein kinase [Tribonema minus]